MKKYNAVYLVDAETMELDVARHGPFQSVRAATKAASADDVVVRIYGRAKVDEKITRKVTLEAFNGKAN